MPRPRPPTPTLCACFRIMSPFAVLSRTGRETSKTERTFALLAELPRRREPVQVVGARPSLPLFTLSPKR
jgi:hypothetical protein